MAAVYRRHSIFTRQIISKCKNITLGYTLPKSVLRKIRFENVRVFVSGENLFTVTDYPGMDPEFSSTSNYYASLRQWAFGLNVKF